MEPSTWFGKVVAWGKSLFTVKNLVAAAVSTGAAMATAATVVYAPELRNEEGNVSVKSVAKYIGKVAFNFCTLGIPMIIDLAKNPIARKSDTLPNAAEIGQSIRSAVATASADIKKEITAEFTVLQNNVKDLNDDVAAAKEAIAETTADFMTKFEKKTAEVLAKLPDPSQIHAH